VYTPLMGGDKMVREVGRFLTASKQGGYSDATLKQYEWHLEKAVLWLSGRGVERVSDIDRDLLREWGAELRDRWSPATIRQAVCAVRAFFLWLYEEEVINSDPGRALKLPRVPQRVQRTLTAGEVARLLTACDPGTTKGARDIALINTLVDTGLRASEIVAVSVGNVNLEARFLLVRVKGGRFEPAYFGDTVVGALEAWLDVRSGVARAGVETVFVSVGGGTPGRPLTTRGLRMILKRLGDSVDVAGVSPHAFRRGFACIADEAGAPTRQIQLAGRWKNIREVERYTLALRRGKLHQRWSPADYVANNDLDP